MLPFLARRWVPNYLPIQTCACSQTKGEKLRSAKTSLCSSSPFLKGSHKTLSSSLKNSLIKPNKVLRLFLIRLLMGIRKPLSMAKLKAHLPGKAGEEQPRFSSFILGPATAVRRPMMKPAVQTQSVQLTFFYLVIFITV